ncbi:hypothetical protein HAX54_048375 [Datura stramonium]|uniref:Uncharacterized protein n=1 Tax=Datura stramonium TaxID=4076 RepID=A0ABS8STL9_DATST|nr:hypothetical protein [Datura stramonium]
MFSCLITSASFLERSVLLQKALASGRNIPSAVSSEERSTFFPADLDLLGVPLVLSLQDYWINPFSILNLTGLLNFFSNLDWDEFQIQTGTLKPKVYGTKKWTK